MRVTSSPGAPHGARPISSGAARLVHLALHGVEHRVLEDEDRIGLAERGQQHAAGVGRRRRRDDLDAGDVRVPALEAVRVLRRELAPAPVAMRTTSGTLNWPPDMCRSVAALLTIWSRASRLKFTVMISTIGRMPPSAAPMPAPTKVDSDSGVSRTRSGPNSSSSPWLHREAAAVAADVLAHQEDARIAPERVAERAAHRFAIGHLRSWRRQPRV